MKVCVLGAGSLGSAIGGSLALTGNEVYLVARPAHAQAMNDKGLVLVYPDGEKIAQVKGCETAEGIGVCDLVIVLSKAFDTESVLRQAAEVVGEETVVVSLQNGLGAEDVIAQTVGAEHVIGGKTYIGGMLLEPGRVQATTAGKETFIGELDGSITPRVEAIARMFEEAGMPCEASDNIMGVIWDKLLVNVATGALCGATRLPYGDFYDDEYLKATSLAAVSEGMSVAAAAGVKLRFDTPEGSWHIAGEGLPRSFKPSILQSLEKKRLTEVDVINGAVVEQGRKYGIACPVNETLVACIHGIERCNEVYGR